MQIQLITLLLGFTLSVSAFADDQTEAKDLFQNYYKVMDQHKIDLIEDVFTEKYIKHAGGKKELAEKIKELPLLKSATVKAPQLELKQGTRSKDLVFAKVKESTGLKGKDASHSHSDFILIRENGKLKIDGTISDGE
jgi:hypothetical protein